MNERIITSAEDAAALAAGAIVVLRAHDEDRFFRTAIYKTWFGSEWIEMDPTDRFDGERSYPKDALWVIATQRDSLVPVLIWTPGNVLEPLTTAEQLAALPDRSIVVAVGGTDEYPTTAIYQLFHGKWTSMDPSDRTDGEDTWSHADMIAYYVVADTEVLHLAWKAPAHD
jgi:hypothetical protein